MKSWVIDFSKGGKKAFRGAGWCCLTPARSCKGTSSLCHLSRSLFDFSAVFSHCTFPSNLPWHFIAQQNNLASQGKKEGWGDDGGGWGLVRMTQPHIMQAKGSRARETDICTHHGAANGWRDVTKLGACSFKYNLQSPATSSCCQVRPSSEAASWSEEHGAAERERKRINH